MAECDEFLEMKFYFHLKSLETEKSLSIKLRNIVNFDAIGDYLETYKLLLILKKNCVKYLVGLLDQSTGKHEILLENLKKQKTQLIFIL